MPRIKMETSVSTRTSYWDYGVEYDVSPEEAKNWVRDGIATYVTGEPVENPEQRATAMERRGPGRPRKTPPR